MARECRRPSTARHGRDKGAPQTTSWRRVRRILPSWWTGPSLVGAAIGFQALAMSAMGGSLNVVRHTAAFRSTLIADVSASVSDGPSFGERLGRSAGGRAVLGGHWT